MGAGLSEVPSTVHLIRSAPARIVCQSAREGVYSPSVSVVPFLTISGDVKIRVSNFSS